MRLGRRRINEVMSNLNHARKPQRGSLKPHRKSPEANTRPRKKMSSKHHLYARNDPKKNATKTYLMWAPGRGTGDGLAPG
jgi:hypothetical protein